MPLRRTHSYGQVPDQGPRQGDGRSQALHVATDIQLYLCDPQNPWQRGTNENTNGQLRRYLPKGIDISSYSQAKLNAVARQLNYKGFPPSQALAGLDVSLSDASRRIKVRIGSLAAMPTCKRSENKSADCKTTTGHVAAFDAADPDGRRAPRLHSRGETTHWCLLQLFELSRRGSNP